MTRLATGTVEMAWHQPEVEGARVWVEARLAPTWPSCPGTQPWSLREHLESPPPLGAPWPVFSQQRLSRGRSCMARVRTGSWGGSNTTGAACSCPWPQGVRGAASAVPSPHLNLHRVLGLGFLGVQELNGHDHLPFALEEHHLGEGSGQTA